MSLLDALHGIDSARSAILTPNQTISFGALCNTARMLAPKLAGKRLVSNTADFVTAVVMLAAADGRAQAVALISAMQDPKVAASLMALIAPDGVLSDQADPLRQEGLGGAIASTLPVMIEQLAVSCAAEMPSGGKTDWILATSGTTGAPKLVSHKLSSLTRTTRCNTDKGRGQVWGLLYDYSRFAGLQVVLQSLLSGACLVVPPFEARLDEQLDFLADKGCTHLSATPTMWRKILMTGRAAALPLRQVTLGGEIADDAVLESLARTYPQARVSHIFASTEAGVGFSVVDGRAGFPVRYLTSPPSGIKIKIEDGQLWVRNEEVGRSYLGGQGDLASNGWVCTGDAVEVQGDRVLFRGRASGVINVGGNKVHPEEVERVLLSHPHVMMAKVYAKANPITGALVFADIVPHPDAADTLRQDVIKFLRSRLERHMVPASLRLIDGIDIGSAGKIKRDG